MTQQCELHRTHSPVPLVLHSHHVIPESWTIKAGLPAGRQVLICPTSHETIHYCLNQFLIHHLPIPAIGASTRALVDEALAWYRDHPVPVPRTTPVVRPMP